MKLWHIMPKEVYDKTIGINKPYICDIFKSKYIQACFWELKPENVVRVYQCRNCAHPERR